MLPNELNTLISSLNISKKLNLKFDTTKSNLTQGRAVDPSTPEHSGVEVSTPERFWGWILFWD